MDEECCISKKLSHKQYKALLKKEKRRCWRQAAAKLQAEHEATSAPPKEEPSAEEAARLTEIEQEQEQKEEKERSIAHEAWLERERLAQETFEIQNRKDEAQKKKLLEEQRRIQEEWEARQKQENRGQSKKERELEVTLQIQCIKILAQMISQSQLVGASYGDFFLEVIRIFVTVFVAYLVTAHTLDVLQQLDKEIGAEKDGPTYNPEAPRQVQQAKQEPCSFYYKTGSCRFGDRCSRTHIPPETSSTLLFPHMYIDFTLEQSRRDEYDMDMALEYDEGDAYERFVEFYNDVLPELKEFGSVVQFKVCCNWEPHLRGNVYVQFRTEEDSSKARDSFHGRFYAGKQLSCIYTPVSSWKAAICGMFHQNKCSRGKNCNFLHVFQNPNREFADADRDFQKLTSWGGQSQRGWRYDQDRRKRERSRSRDRSRDHRRRSRSRDRRHRSRDRSRSQERRHGFSSRSRRSRSRDRTKRKRSRTRSRSQSRSPRRTSRRHRSRSGSRSRRRSSRSPRKTGTGSQDRSLHHNRSRSRSRNRDSRSPSNPRSSRSRSVSPQKRKKKNRRSPSRLRNDQQSSSDCDNNIQVKTKHRKKKHKSAGEQGRVQLIEPSHKEPNQETNTDSKGNYKERSTNGDHDMEADKVNTCQLLIKTATMEGLKDKTRSADNGERDLSPKESIRDDSAGERAGKREDESKSLDIRLSRSPGKDEVKRSCRHTHKKKHKHKKHRHKKQRSSPHSDT